MAPTVTPEPSSFALLGTGLLGVAGGVMRKRFA
ncbi:MAG: PEP-CTERM sorting domain-containing protein [Edaphobacter sp.]